MTYRTYHPSDQSALRSEVAACLNDKRIKSYFDRKLVSYDEVKQLIDEGNALNQAMETKAYQAYNSFSEEVVDRSQRRAYVLLDPSTLRIAVSLVVLLFAVIAGIAQLLEFGIIANAAFLASGISVGIAGYLVAGLQQLENRRPAHLILVATPLLATLTFAVAPHFLLAEPWNFVTTYFAVMAIGLAVYLLAFGETLEFLREILIVIPDVTSMFTESSSLYALRAQWLNDAAEAVIMPSAVLAINTLLGNEQDKLLVEQDSEGLRRLQDPTFRVSTRSVARLGSLLSQMDGGSVAVSGPRGAGKSTLLRQFCEPLDGDIASTRGLSVYVSAPSNYVAIDFIAELFQQLCEGYLKYCECLPAERLYEAGGSKAGVWRVAHRLVAISWLLARTTFAVALVSWIVWQFHKNIPPSSFVMEPIGQWAQTMPAFARTSWSAHRAYLVLAILVLALTLWPGIRAWRRHLWRRREPEMTKKAREYLLRLQIDKTVTRSAGIAPSVRGMGFSINRGTAAKYTPWTLPELVSYTRGFMRDIAVGMIGKSCPVVIAIDEIDRIGSVEHAEAFIGDIKTIFGVEKCYFIVAVAEDVGSLFAQRATAGRSILENAFDEIVTVGPLELQEARNLLLKRVPGFTDSFVYLVYALSGGLPRELIRVSRRLVEINLDRANAEDFWQRPPEFESAQKKEGADESGIMSPQAPMAPYPRLADLALNLVKEGVIEAIDASRNQMSSLSLPSMWAWYFDKMRSASRVLRSSTASSSISYREVEILSAISVPRMDKPDGDSVTTPKAQEDERIAMRILSRLAAFAYFGITIIDAFSDHYFDLDEVRRRTATEDENSYEQLAVARVELSLFAESARMILDRFRQSLAS